MRLILLLGSAFLAACSPGQPRAAEQPTEIAATLPQPAGAAELPGPPPPPPPSPILPGLLPLSRAQVAAAIGPGPACALSERGSTLMAAKPGAAIVNDRGRIIRLKPESENREDLREGGTFRAGKLRIEVDAGAVIARRPRRIERDASVKIVRGRHGFGSSHGPAWVCGS